MLFSETLCLLNMDSSLHAQAQFCCGSFGPKPLKIHSIQQIFIEHHYEQGAPQEMHGLPRRAEQHFHLTAYARV